MPSVELTTVFDLTNPEIVSALLDAQQKQQSVRVYTLEGEKPWLSKILGFDYYEKALLVDGFSPPLPTSRIQAMTHSPFWVQLPHQDQYLNLYCLIEESRFDLFTLKILKCEFTENQRWFSRIHFEPRKGPTLDIRLPHELPVKGFIKNLSVHGAKVDFYGENLRERLFGLKSCFCHMRFNDMFAVEFECQIKNLSFERKPSCHTQLRLMFNDHSPLTYIQLENFIDAFNDGRYLSATSNTHYTSTANFV